MTECSSDIDADQDGTTARGIDDIRQVDTALAAAVGVNPLTPVPEPATWALLLVGFAAAGAALRSPRRVRRLSASYS